MIGFDIGGTKCAVTVGNVTKDGLEIKEKKSIPTDLGISPYEMIDKMCRLAETMTDDFSRIGISCGGPLDSKRGIIMSPPNLPGWDDVRVCEFLTNRYGSKVNLQNDANACAVAEWKFGAGRGCSNMIFLTFGTGLLKRYPELNVCMDDITRAVDLFVDTYENGGKILVCGNGGSAADSEHIVGELMKGFLLRREVHERYGSFIFLSTIIFARRQKLTFLGDRNNVQSKK